MEDANSNPYQSPLIAADEHSVRVSGGSRALHIGVVGFGATLGGVAMFAASCAFLIYTDRGPSHETVVFVPIGAVVGGLFAKWCALQFRPLH